MTSFDSTTTSTALPAADCPRKARVQVPALPALELLGPGADANARGRVERRIAAAFAERYGATVDHFLPHLLCLSASHRLGAVAGLRLARESTLFLEQYFDVPVEQAVSGAYRTPVDRTQVVEIGNLASFVQGSAALLFALLPTILRAAGMRWVVCTATPQVRAILDKLRLPVRAICVADPDRLGAGKDSWGSYYSGSPQVIVGDAWQVDRQALQSRMSAVLRRALDGPVDQVAAALRPAR